MHDGTYREDGALTLDPSVMKEKRYSEAPVTDRYNVELFTNNTGVLDDNQTLSQLFSNLSRTETDKNSITQYLFQETAKLSNHEYSEEKHTGYNQYYLIGMILVISIFFIFTHRYHKKRKSVRNELNYISSSF